MLVRICFCFVFVSFFLSADPSVDTRLSNINLMREALHKGKYQGYDIVIISSTSEEEASFQQQVLENAFADTIHVNGRSPIILSVVDTTEGGQIIGSVFTWLQAEKKMSEKYPEAHNLISYIKTHNLKVAAFHNGGKGERCSPLTQSLGNSRGAQKLVGSVINAKGENINLDILLSVVLQCSSFAANNPGTHFDNYWTSQIAFGSNLHEELVRSNYAVDKFLVGFDKDNVIAQNIADFGTAALDEEGRMTAFYGNKRFASRIGSEYVVDKPKITRELFEKGSKVAYDFGSFAVRLDMWEILVDYWKRKCDLENIKGKSPFKRDIDPHFIQPCLRFLHALDLWGDYTSLEAHAYIWEGVIGETDSACMHEVIEFYQKYSHTSAFSNLKKVFGHIDLGDETQWFRYRRPIDILNEKLEMLSDIIGNQIEVQLDGYVKSIPSDEKIFQRSREARLMRGISDNIIADFQVDDISLAFTREEIKTGKYIEGVYVKNSIIRNSQLAPGSVIIDSVLNNVTGKIIAKSSYLESSLAPLIFANSSIVHQCVDANPIIGDKEVISDVYRTKLSPPYHGRMRAPIGYDPKGMPVSSIRDFINRLPYDFGNETMFSDKTARTEDGRFTFEEIREIEPIKTADNEFRESLKPEKLQTI